MSGKSLATQWKKGERLQQQQRKAEDTQKKENEEEVRESKRYKMCLDVHFWQFKHIKLIFIHVFGMERDGGGKRSQDTLFRLAHSAGWFGMMKSLVVAFNLTWNCFSLAWRRKPHGAIKTFPKIWSKNLPKGMRVEAFVSPGCFVGEKPLFYSCSLAHTKKKTHREVKEERFWKVSLWLF